MKRRIAYAGAAMAAVFAVGLTAPAASASEHDWTVGPSTAQSGPSADDGTWGIIGPSNEND